MKIIALEARNVKRLKAVQITPTGDLVVIGGDNAAGKSSVLDGIAMALGGKSLMCPEPVRRGEEKAEVRVDLDEYQVIRTFTPEGGGTLTVKDKRGAKFPSPQALLDSLTGKLCFDPLAFSRMDAAPQLKVLRELVGVDTEQLDRSRQTEYDERTALNRELKGLEAQAAAAPRHEHVPAEEVSTEKLLEELTLAQKFNQQLTDLQREGEGKKTALANYEQRTKEDEEEIQGLQAQIEGIRNRIKARTVDVEKAKTELADLRMKYVEMGKPKDLAAITAQIGAVQATNKKVSENRWAAELKAKVAAKRIKVEASTKKIDAFDAEKRKLLEAAKFPVEGLAFDANGVTFNGLPFEQASSAEQLRVSVAMGIALNPKLQVLLIRDGSLLDAASLQMIAEMAAAAKAQVWLERVGKGQECSVIIEDGMVEERTAIQPAAPEAAPAVPVPVPGGVGVTGDPGPKGEKPAEPAQLFQPEAKPVRKPKK